MTEHAMTVDVEEWFHVLDAKGAPDPVSWDELPSRLERNCDRLLELFAHHGVRTTQFWLGWAAERFPQLIKRAHAAGHEIASHGQQHLLAYQVGPQRFAEDIRRSKQVIEDLIGDAVVGFRAPGFSFTEQTPWVYEALAGAGYRYSSSLFPAARGHGGFVGAQPQRRTVETPLGPVEEFPITTIELFGRRFCLFGGGYLRVTPWPVLSRVSRKLASQGRPIIFYLHPREIDPDQPRMWRLPPHRFFKYYVNLRHTEEKLRKLLATQRFTPLVDWL